MRHVLIRSDTVVWVLLVGLTLLVWTEPLLTLEAVPAAASATFLVLMAAVKVRLIGLHFMELRTAPLALRGLFEAWLVVVAVVLTSILWFL